MKLDNRIERELGEMAKAVIRASKAYKRGDADELMSALEDAQQHGTSAYKKAYNSRA